ncbi:helix-turn-helix transcriptional regulator [Halorubrum sp. DTA46]|uniref:helix-turn-helix transcriptional regulator n=1 Tax=Halorubrum sp. DTA46 TaxID=3402162 RepID=UPI003AB0EB89
MRNPALRVLLVAVIAVALVAGAGAPVAGDAVSTLLSSPDGATADASATPSLAAQMTETPQLDDGFDPNTETRIRIEPSPDRDARWEVSVRYELTDSDERTAFETAADQFLAGEIGPDASLFEGFAREASRNVDRTMRIESVDRDTTVHENPSAFDVAGDEAVAVGELRLTFVWTGFLAEDGENLVLGDALTTPNDGTWLRSLEEGQTLEVATPDGYTVTGTPGATVPLRDNAVIIEGPRAFGDDERVAVVYAPTGAVGPPWTMLTAAIVLAALLIAGSIVGYRRMDDDGAPTNGGGVDGGGGGGAGVGGAAAVGANADGDAPTGASPDDGGSSEPETEPDLSLLSDEERVERLLVDNGGRMRQADIVSETGWSDAKVSQLLSAMADAGRVEKLRLGRENLISLPDDASDSGDSSGSDDSDGSGPDGGKADNATADR